MKEKTKVKKIQRQKTLQEIKKQAKGITLIALVVTIIVLLILAAVAINLTIGNNGIFTKAQIAVVRNENASVYEQLQLVVADYQIDAYETGNNEEILNRLKADGYVEEDSEGNNIVNVENLMKKSMQTGKGNIADGDVYVIEKRQQTASSVTSDITVEMNYYLIYYDEENIDLNLGLAFEGNLSGSSAWNEIFETAKKHPEQSESNEAIGIDSNGNPVNMDLWKNEKTSDGLGYSLEGFWGCGTPSPAYIGKIENGKIEGEIPKYIKGENDDKFYPVTVLYGTFAGIIDLTVAPKIPDTIKNMDGALQYTGIIEMPELPENVTSLRSSFEGCDNLIEVSNLPPNVTDMHETFSNCKNLYKVTKIPDSVTNMEATFEDCANLVEIEGISANVINMEHTFHDCRKLSKGPKIIPESVENMDGTFRWCTSLTGTMEINANFEHYNDYDNCFEYASTADNANLVLTGSCTDLEELVNTADEDSHITIQK